MYPSACSKSNLLSLCEIDNTKQKEFAIVLTIKVKFFQDHQPPNANVSPLHQTCGGNLQHVPFSNNLLEGELCKTRASFISTKAFEQSLPPSFSHFTARKKYAASDDGSASECNTSNSSRTTRAVRPRHIHWSNLVGWSENIVSSQIGSLGISNGLASRNKQTSTRSCFESQPRRSNSRRQLDKLRSRFNNRFYPITSNAMKRAHQNRVLPVSQRLNYGLSTLESGSKIYRGTGDKRLPRTVSAIRHAHSLCRGDGLWDWQWITDIRCSESMRNQTLLLQWCTWLRIFLLNCTAENTTYQGIDSTGNITGVSAASMAEFTEMGALRYDQHFVGLALDRSERVA